MQSHSNLTQKKLTQTQNLPRRFSLRHTMFAIGILGLITLYLISINFWAYTPQNKLEKLQARLEQLVHLKTTRKSQLHRLKTEIQKIEAEKLSPAQFKHTYPDPNKNLVPALVSIWPHGVRNSLYQIAKIYAENSRLGLNSEGRAEIRKFLKEHKTKIRRIRLAAKKTESDFSLLVQHGPVQDRSFIEDVSVACWLLQIETANYLINENMRKGVESFSLAWKITDALANETDMECRLLANRFRAELYELLKKINRSQSFRQTQAEKIYKLLSHTSDHWPTDREMLIAERARAMLAYEAVRHGLIEEILSPEHVLMLKQEEQMKQIPQTGPVLDEDEHLYLSVLRKMILASEKPYYKRENQLNEIKKQLIRLRNKETYPYLAIRIYLPGLIESQKKLATGHAACMRWEITLGKRFKPVQHQVSKKIWLSPLTGVPLRELQLARKRLSKKTI